MQQVSENWLIVSGSRGNIPSWTFMEAGNFDLPQLFDVALGVEQHGFFLFFSYSSSLTHLFFSLKAYIHRSFLFSLGG
jgi:hypothetical protein